MAESRRVQAFRILKPENRFLTSGMNYPGGKELEPGTMNGFFFTKPGLHLRIVESRLQLKVKVGKQLNSQAILADANCTKTCLYLSLVLLLSSVGYELTGMGGMDSAGALIIAGLSFKEGREAFEKAKGKCCGCGDT